MGRFNFLANAECGGVFKCLVCEKEAGFKWTEVHGIAVCNRCNVTYKLLHYDNNGKKIEGHKPELDVHEDFLPFLKVYWQETKRGCGLGNITDNDEPYESDREAFFEWINANFPELFTEEDFD